MAPVLIPPIVVVPEFDDEAEFQHERLEAYLRGLILEGIDCPNMIGRLLEKIPA